MSQFNSKTFRVVLLLMTFILAIVGFPQNKNEFTLQFDSFYAKIKEQKNPQIIADLQTVKVFPTLNLYRKGKIFFKKEDSQDLKKDVDMALTIE